MFLERCVVQNEVMELDLMKFLTWWYFHITSLCVWRCCEEMQHNELGFPSLG